MVVLRLIEIRYIILFVLQIGIFWFYSKCSFSDSFNIFLDG